MQHGQTKLPDAFRPRVPVAGNLKIGDLEERGGKQLPKKTDYIRFCSPSPTKDGRYPEHPAFLAENEAHHRTFTIELVSDDPEVNLEIAWVMAGRGNVLCRGNGKEAERRIDAGGKLDPNAPFQALPAGTCGDHCPFARSRACKLASTLRFRIPGRTPLGHVWQFRTTSWNTAQDLLGAMQAIKEMTGGTLARIPLAFTMTEQRRNPIVNGTRTASTFFSVSLAFMGEEHELLDVLEKAVATKQRYGALGLKTLEERLVEQGPTVGREEGDEARALALEFYEDGTAVAAEAWSEDAPAPEPVTAAAEPAAGAPGVEVTVAEAVSFEEVLQEPERPRPASKPWTGELVTPNQRRLILGQAKRVRGVDMEALEARLGTLTKAEASPFIELILKDPKAAFAPFFRHHAASA